jgi:hypothetical protein
MTLRAEHESLARYLQQELSNTEAQHIGLISFNQWSFALGAVCETALAARDIGSKVTVAFWSGKTPLYDTGWTAHRTIARLLGSASRDHNAYRALRSAGFPKQTFARPPLRHWKPQESLPIPVNTRRDTIRTLTYRGSGMGRSILQVHPDTNTPIRDDYEWPARYLQETIRSYAWAYDQAYAVIQQRKLTTVVVYNGRFTHDRAVAAAAQALGARTLYYDTGGYQTDFDLTTATTHDWQHLQERMKAMSQTWGDEGIALGSQWFLNRQNHSDAKNAIFTADQKIGHLPELPEAETLVIFFSSSGDEIAELELDWSEFFGSQENALRLLAETCRKRPSTALVVRTHPHMRLKPEDDLKRWVQAVEQIAPDLHFGPESTIDSYALMQVADVVFTYGSTTGVEAAFQGRPVVVMGPSAYDALGCAKKISTQEEIRQAIDHPPMPHPDSTTAFGLMMQCRGFTYCYGHKDSDDTPVIASVRLDEANEWVRKLSAAVKSRQTARLTK